MNNLKHLSFLALQFFSCFSHSDSEPNSLLQVSHIYNILIYNMTTWKVSWNKKLYDYKEIKLSNIEKYNDYKLKEKILFDCNLMLATDKEKYILEYPTSKYITQGNKLNKLFFHTGKLNDSIDCYSNKFII